ncbi:acetyl-CoA carboxylase biotin carboxyl carrier protein [Microbispora siamensis]
MTDTSTSGASPSPAAQAPGGPAALATLCDRLTGILAATRDRPVARLRLAYADAEVELTWAREQAAPTAPGRPAGQEEPAPPGPAGHRITAPLVGTFYAAPAPGEKPFVQVGDHVVIGQRLAVLEAMKLMNGIEADVTGVVAAIRVTDGTPVEYGQELFVITPETA